eukprot:CAMPEP_0194771060 /NCGR_PEP_ID=MMETSP0323_2-20130528/48116_1 /TAXON_ID=2866 ORGANISM="Crypthecodinium cohnii, Strain Seligo" /NCGR_SAMPLE_ID=MMETSP0323_2 /ASSEMBLY_ACC=CAM_ASM_000346 /LENGTH=118 /DNA_ID=CAMNT_0039704971 /DNA_START=1 /DNA_END=354 /DNA_ORIENTATION=+
MAVASDFPMDRYEFGLTFAAPAVAVAAVIGCSIVKYPTPAPTMQQSSILNITAFELSPPRVRQPRRVRICAAKKGAAKTKTEQPAFNSSPGFARRPNQTMLAPRLVAASCIASTVKSC